jgi:hypothetical protein
MRHSKILEKHNIEMILQLKTKFSPFKNDISRIRNILVYKIKGRKMTTAFERFLCKMSMLMSEPAFLFSFLLYS